MIDVDVDFFLEHHGVKGQKWGIRNDILSFLKDHGRKNSPKTKTSTHQADKTKKTYLGMSKKQIIVGSTILVGLGVTAVILANRGAIKTSLLKKEFNASNIKDGQSNVNELLAKQGSSKDIIFPKGHIFTRISNHAQTELHQGNYANYDPKDVARYKAFWNSDTSRFNTTIESISDVKTPSLNVRLKTMEEMIDKPLPGVFKNSKTIRSSLMKQESTLRGKLWVRSAPASELAKYNYASIAGGSWSSGQGKVYAESLIKKGYGAMTDDEDVIRLAKAPMVLLDKGLFRIVNSKKMTTSDINAAYSDFQKLLST